MRAILLTEEPASVQDRNLEAMVGLFRVRYVVATVDQLLRHDTSPEFGRERVCVLTSARCLASALAGSGGEVCVPAAIRAAAAIYVYGFEDASWCQALLRLLSADRDARILRPTGPAASRLSVAADCPEICGPMSGLSFDVPPASSALFEVRRIGEQFQRILQVGEQTLFFRVLFQGVPFYLNASTDIVDVTSPARTSFDIRRQADSTVPSVLFLKHFFPTGGCETGGCLVVDDPLLRPRYGFLRFSDALEAMDQVGFTTSLAFIPWNWRRTERRTVALFRQRADRLSLSVHGCDHTDREFGEQSLDVLNRRLQTAVTRMEGLRERTSLSHDRVMVFPQGVFSPQTLEALKANGFIGAVNTEVAPLDERDNQTTIGDLWDVALMKYGSFPIFTRRYLTHGVENFAFDALLGKPCLLVAHHDAFKDRSLVEFIGQLNRLHWNLRWRSLADVVVRSVSTWNDRDVSRVRMFATRIALTNPDGERREVVVEKQESSPQLVNTVLVNSLPSRWAHEHGSLRFTCSIEPHATLDATICYRNPLGLPNTHDSAALRMKTAARRYLSEFRDNYMSQSLFRQAGRLTESPRADE